MKGFSDSRIATFAFCTRNATRGALAAMAAAMLLLAQPVASQVQSSASPTVAASPNFGLVGLAFNQTLRITVVAPATQPGFPPSPCAAALCFSSFGVFGQRAEVRPVVTLLPNSVAPNACQVSAEVFDTFAGRTWIYAIPPGPAE